ncbi:CorA family divalent cation transporter [Cellulomonas sp. PhB143]|uniref:CorA family divalent cation transporter n=1 Tax=Cellulomonas sp. PhB143 TaxID=2485186 RepID=UPI000F46F434|nr:CorA family divalent cation transporter [Cellulomonas sp. PhB143]ROS73693.1 magnesium transporter [Cellulomonas sp. PhB143]
MSDDDGSGPAGTQQWFVGDRGGAVERADGTHSTRWLQAEDRDAFLDAARELAPALRDRPSAGTAVHGLPHRPAAAVRRIDDDWVLVLTPTVWFTDDDRQVRTGELGCLVGPDAVLTFEDGSAGVCEHARERLDAPGPHRAEGPRRILLAVVMALVAAATRVEVALGDAVADTERLVFDRGVTDPVPQVYDLKREITEARRALLPLSAELPELADPDDEKRALVGHRALERVVATVERVDRHLDAHDGLLSDMLQVHLAQVSVRQNEDMRKISAWAAILVYPTVVAGVYGMNFSHMPELHWLLGYPFAMALMVVGCVVLFRVFRRVGWL